MGHIDFQDDIEKNKHEEAIKQLCEQFPGQQEQIRENYLANLEPMIADASIRTYLPIFVSRKVKNSLNRH